MRTGASTTTGKEKSRHTYKGIYNSTYRGIFRMTERSRRPKCPECGSEMALREMRSHHYWLCVGNPRTGVLHDPVQLGIIGDVGYFQFRKLIDPVTFEITDNPYFQKEES